MAEPQASPGLDQSVNTHDQILRFAGWTADWITRLVNNLLCPDHWHLDQPMLSFALPEAIIREIDVSDTLNYRKDLIPGLISMGLKEPKIALHNLLSKVKHN